MTPPLWQAVERWIMANHWADAAAIAGLVSDWDAIAERHFPAYQASRATFQGQRQLRPRDLLPRVGIDRGAAAADHDFSTSMSILLPSPIRRPGADGLPVVIIPAAGRWSWRGV